tara:strand:- start:665 stop:1681 length:1017 start_codon:yes stop_codon:yes gene_type:complete
MSQINSDLNKKIDLISKKIFNHFLNKYPTFFPSLNINEQNIKRIVSVNKNKLDTNTINYIITTIENKIKNIENGPNRKIRGLDKNKVLDPGLKTIKENKYLEKYDHSLKNQVLQKTPEQEDTSYLQQQLQPLSNSFPPDEKKQIQKMMESEEVEHSYYVVIDSKDRDKDKFPSTNNFVVDFAAKENGGTGSVSTGFQNVVNIELVEAIILDSSDENDASDNATNFPYLLLDIKELGSQFEGTNTNIMDSFSILRDYSLQNGFKYYNLVGFNGVEPIKKEFSPRKSISRMTIHLKTPDGTTFNFGAANNNSNTTVIHLVFKINAIRKNLGTRFLDASTF